MGDGIAATSAVRLTGGDTAARPREASTGSSLQGSWAAPDSRRVLQLALAGLWVLTVIGYLLGPETKGKELEELTDEALTEDLVPATN